MIKDCPLDCSPSIFIHLIHYNIRLRHLQCEAALQSILERKKKTPPYLNLLLVLEQGSLQKISECKVVTLDVERCPGHLLHAFPVPCLHGFVGHQFQQRHHLVEVVNLLPQLFESWPVLQGFRQLATPCTTQTKQLQSYW